MVGEVEEVWDFIIAAQDATEVHERQLDGYPVGETGLNGNAMVRLTVCHLCPGRRLWEASSVGQCLMKLFSSSKLGHLCFLTSPSTAPFHRKWKKINREDEINAR